MRATVAGLCEAGRCAIVAGEATYQFGQRRPTRDLPRVTAARFGYPYGMSRLVLLALMVSGPAPVAGFAGHDEVDFVESVRPILTRHCSRCHGERQAEGGLRLHTKAAAFGPTDSAEAVLVPGKPEASLLLQRITTSDTDARMPADSEPLSQQEIATLKRWIDAGAHWPENADGRHWAYTAPTRPAVPDVAVEPHGNTVDRFIGARLRSRKLEPNARADRARLLRRVSLTLTGLPPSLEELDTFLDDSSENAYERAVDRLLASKLYGERWAQHWLDLARYADSNGFQADQLREIWAYRDWVINALNEDMPFDQFTIEQLAGDLLPGATAQQKIATGFHRTVPCNVEAGVHPEENRTNQVFDRVNTTGTVFLGATLECAQCHDHKYDPYSQQEYYRLFAFFNNTPLEVKLNSGVQYELEGPKMDLPLPPDKSARLAELKATLSQLTKQRDSLKPSTDQQREWEQRVNQALRNGVRWQTPRLSKLTSTGGENLAQLENGSVLVSGQVPDKTVYTLECVGPIPDVRHITAIRIEALTHPSLPGSGPGRGDKVRNNFILSELTVQVRQGKNTRPVALHSPTADFSQKGWPVAAAIDGDRKTGWAIAPQFSKPHSATFVLNEPVELKQNDSLVVTLDQNYGAGRTLGCVRVSLFSGEPSAVGLPPKLAAAIRRKPARRTPAQRKLIDDHYSSSNPRLKQLTQRITTTEQQMNAIRPPTTLVMVEMDKARETHVLQRGNYLDPGPRVPPGTPRVLHTFDEKQYASNRLGFAQWLVSKENPLWRGSP